MAEIEEFSVQFVFRKSIDDVEGKGIGCLERLG